MWESGPLAQIQNLKFKIQNRQCWRQHSTDVLLCQLIGGDAQKPGRAAPGFWQREESGLVCDNPEKNQQQQQKGSIAPAPPVGAKLSVFVGDLRWGGRPHRGFRCRPS